MEKDEIITISDGQSLRLRKLNNFLSPIVLTYRQNTTEKPETVTFSIESVRDKVETR